MGSSKFTLQPEWSLKTELKKSLNASARALSSEKVKLDNLFRDKFPLAFEGEKCPEFRVTMDFASNGNSMTCSGIWQKCRG